MNKKFGLMKRFVNDLVVATVILSVLLPLLAVPVIATITNEGVKQLTTDPEPNMLFMESRWHKDSISLL